MKLFNILLCVFLLKSDVFAQLCLNNKSQQTCVCERTTNPQTYLSFMKVDCSFIGLKTFPDWSQLIYDLNVLDLSYNRIERIETDYANPTNYLEILNLSYNNVSYINPNFFEQTPNIRELDLSHNNIKSLGDDNLFASTKKLISIDLSYNKLTVLPDKIFLPLTQLQILKLNFNHLVDYVTKSDVLFEAANLTTTIKHLELDGIGLKTVENTLFHNLTELTYLSLADNELETIPIIPYTVTYLDLSGNKLRVIQAKYLNYHALKILKLDRMESLESIHNYAMYNLQSLEELSISYCVNLQEFNEFIFGILYKSTRLTLRKLSLARNGLKTLNRTYEYLFDKLDYLDLSHNPWNCDCQVLWLQELTNLFRNGEYMRCEFPNGLRNRLVTSLGEKDLMECYPEKYGKKSHRITIAILVLLIIALLVFIAYLVSFTPNWTANRRLGPNSPYNPARLEDE